ncbi:hypothetical protein J4E83_005446 [Alternaria metachromatica]|uniref:uncharacterized protein n=1 Tax=Alternaria metachromatica TaxID=283354 RepID=UPI0020C1F168|nr:uncharacterized protein J4E83_005446 [Alternaria metachromatica]KAI4621083.1 hypothetical protein J4E83_005446 [Alternaria metachromatica]
MRKAEYRWGDIRGVLTLYEIKQLTMTELQWFTLNYAVRDAGIAWKRQLLPEHDDAARNMSQIIWKRRTDTEERLAAVRMLFFYRVISMSTTTNKAEQAVSYAALILADEGIAITPEKLQALLKAAGIEDVEPIWTTLFSKAFDGKDVKDIILTATTATPAGRGDASDIKDDGKTTGEDGDDEKDGEEGIDIDADSDDGSAFGDLFG